MTAIHLTAPRAVVREPVAVDIAGSRWPVYKLEALVVGLLVFLVGTVVPGSVQTGVLLGAAVGVLLWSAGWWRSARR